MSSSSSVSMHAPLAIPATEEAERTDLEPSELFAPLPNELLVQIFSLLSIKDAVRLSGTSRFFNILFRDVHLCEALYDVDSRGLGLGEFAEVIQKAKQIFITCSGFTSLSVMKTIIAKQKLTQINKRAQQSFGDTVLIAKTSSAFSGRLSTSEDRVGVKYQRERVTPQQKFNQTGLPVFLVGLFRGRLSKSEGRMDGESRKRKRRYDKLI